MIACIDRTGERLSLVAILMTLSLFGSGIPILRVDYPGFTSITCSVDGGVKHGIRIIGAHLRGHEVSAVGAFPSAPPARDRSSLPKDFFLASSIVGAEHSPSPSSS